MLGAHNIKGVRQGGEPDNEADHFYTCACCGQAVDKRNFNEVFHHEILNHKPMEKRDGSRNS